MSILLAAAAPAAVPVNSSSPFSAPAKAPAINVADMASQVLNLRDSQVVTLSIPNTIGVPVNTPLTINGVVYSLNLNVHSIRSPFYALKVQVPGGAIVDADPGPVNTLRGSILEIPGSIAAGGMMDNGLYALIRMPDGARWWIEPIAGRVPGAQPGQYVIYNSDDVIPNGGTCGVTEQAKPFAADVQDQGGIAGGTLMCADYGADADVEFFNSYGSVSAVQNRINLVVNTLNVQYESQVDISHKVSTIVVRTAEPDPYGSTNVDVLLNAFINEWNNNQTSFPHDVAQLYSGKNFDGSTIGYAPLSSVCTSSGYSIVQSDCCGSLSCSADLSSHELGHNWSAPHCTCPGETMNPSITCANTFGAATISTIVAFRNTRSCLGVCENGTTTLPFLDTFPTTTIDTLKWTGIEGAASNNTASGTSEPSAPNSLNLDGSSTGGDVVRTAIMDLRNFVNLSMTYWYERRGGGDSPETGDDLVVDYQDINGTWVELSRQLGSGADQTTFTSVTLALPAGVKHQSCRFRFRCISTQVGNDDWFVDDISITGIAELFNNICSNAEGIFPGIYGYDTNGADTDGPAEALCNINGSNQVSNDIWYFYVPDCVGSSTTTASVCGSTFNTRIAVYTDCPGVGGTIIACNDDSCGTSSSITFPTVDTSFYIIRLGGHNGAKGTGTLTVSCTPDSLPCPGDIAPQPTTDGEVNIDDLTAIILAWGTADPDADIDNDGDVEIDDLTAVILGWGTCP